jgi:hypothetical protein
MKTNIAIKATPLPRGTALARSRDPVCVYHVVNRQTLEVLGELTEAHAQILMEAEGMPLIRVHEPVGGMKS